ncbi:hypothetical protein EGW08_007505 [Elysia chlorotica]|uniref:Uncharacterized protein n=1 Tax=Elysia chlorotica TaxID=188477 RepID=A0A3S1A7N8_ELYCH|nr:hypothetical protein EGW08_007505 [Elysia chlorotica]
MTVSEYSPSTSREALPTDPEVQLLQVISSFSINRPGTFLNDSLRVLAVNIAGVTELEHGTVVALNLTSPRHRLQRCYGDVLVTRDWKRRLRSKFEILVR